MGSIFKRNNTISTKTANKNSKQKQQTKTANKNSKQKQQTKTKPD